MAKENVNTNGCIHNIINFGTKIVGKITSDSDFRLDGEVEGDIVCKGKLIIGQKGHLKGSIMCANAEIIGTVIGNIQVADTLTLRSTSSLNGDVRTKSLVVEPNAIFNGTCSMKDTGTEVTQKEMVE